MTRDEYDAGPDQVIVVYDSDDTGGEVDPFALFADIAKDAARRAATGWRIVSTADIPLRHTQALLAKAGSGYTSAAAIAVVYARSTHDGR